MNRVPSPQRDGRSPDAPRWLALGLGAIAAHQIQSLAAEPAERRFRIAALMGLAAMPFTLLLPTPARGALMVINGMPAVAGTLVGHLVPLVRRRRVPPATETAPLNLAGGVLLVAVGLALLLPRARR
jgi:hypothetical protein